MASRIFWASYSAYARCETPQRIDALLDLLSEENNADWHNDTEHIGVWRQGHDEMVKFYEDKIKHYADEYLSSAAGKKYKEAVAMARKKSRKIPPLTIDTLRKFEGAEGIQWSVQENSDFFLFLMNFTDTEPVCLKDVWSPV